MGDSTNAVVVVVVLVADDDDGMDVVVVQIRCPASITYGKLALRFTLNMPITRKPT